MIYLLETYAGQNATPQCLIHCPLNRFDDLFKYCHETFGAFRLTKFAEYAYELERIPFYSEEKNFDNLESRGIPPRPARGPFDEFDGPATVRNLSQ